MTSVVPSAMPRVTIVMPSYNHVRYIEQAIRSVLSQNYCDIELIVIDDCSKDGSRDLIARLQDELSFRYIQHETNQGLNSTLMEGYQTGTGKYTTMLASDDALLPGKLEKQVAYLEQTGKDGVYATGLKLWDDGRTEAIGLDVVARRFAAGTMRDYAYVNDVNAPLFQSGLFNRQAILDLFSYRARYKSDDWIILIKLLEDYDIGFINEPMFLYRQHENNSFRRYWDMFPARIDVAATAIPDSFRAEALSNIMYSQAQYLLVDGRYGIGAKMWLAAFALKPRFAMIAQTLGAAFRRLGR